MKSLVLPLQFSSIFSSPFYLLLTYFLSFFVFYFYTIMVLIYLGSPSKNKLVKYLYLQYLISTQPLLLRLVFYFTMSIHQHYILVIVRIYSLNQNQHWIINLLIHNKNVQLESPNYLFHSKKKKGQSKNYS